MTQFKSGLQKARWPIAKLAPELLYGVGALAQGETSNTLVHVKALNELVGRLHAINEEGQARLSIVPTDLSSVAVVAVMDASFANEPGKKSQAGFIGLVATDMIKNGPVRCSIAEFKGSTISRVVRSTVAAEAAGMSLALDRHLYCRLLVECLFFTWRARIRGRLATQV